MSWWVLAVLVALVVGPGLAAALLWPRARGPGRARPEASGYGYGGAWWLRRRELAQRLCGRRRATRHHYVDYAGAPPAAPEVVRGAAAEALARPLGNPHSAHAAGAAAAAALDAARSETLRLLNAPPGEYCVVFTGGATGAARLVAEAFPFGPGGALAHPAAVHTSVLGVREHALRAGAAVRVVDLASEPPACVAELARRAEAGGGPAAGAARPRHSLLAFAAECNFDGARSDVASLVRRARAWSSSGERWWTLMDAAKACATGPPDLSEAPADFVTLSYYKIFGSPTGLGALVARREALELLRPPWFAGGTVSAVAADADFVRLRPSGPERFEGGTPDFQGVAALLHGFRWLARIGGPPAVAAHAGAVARRAAEGLAALRHAEGGRACVLYGGWGKGGAGPPGEERGATVAFSVLRADGTHVGYREVERQASLRGVELRGGCMCNPGACAQALGLTAEDVANHFARGKVCGDELDTIDGRPTGALRASFGWGSTLADADALVEVVREDFVRRDAAAAAAAAAGAPAARVAAQTVSAVYVYPVKSCGAHQVPRGRGWPVGDRGLLYDREWAVVDDDGRALSQKALPGLALIRPAIDLAAGELRLSAPGRPTVAVPLHDGGSGDSVRVSVCGEACGVTGEACGTTGVDAWLSDVLGRRCRLVRASGACERSKASGRVAFANDGQLLALCSESVEELNRRLRDAGEPAVPAARFRPNLVLEGCSSGDEDGWGSLTLDDGVTLTVAGPCTRCAMVNVDQATGHRSRSEPLLTLSKFRRGARGRVHFGVLLGVSSAHRGALVRPGARVAITAAENASTAAPF